MTSKIPKVTPVNISYTDLIRQDGSVNLDEAIREGFGPDGLGLITISDVPSLSEKRQECLPLAFEFAERLDENVKEKYVHEKSFYSFGWSHGKEKFLGKPDLAKGSYYANPQYDSYSFTDKEEMKSWSEEEKESFIEKWAPFIHPNIWPDTEPGLEQYGPSFKTLGQLVVDVGSKVAYHCDKYIQNNLGDAYTEKNKLFRIITESRCCKGRLLHYFDATSSSNFEQETEEIKSSSAKVSSTQNPMDDFWCGWHNDHGSLTGLVPAMYIEKATGKEITSLPPGDVSGLYIYNRAGQLVKPMIPKNCLAFQIGETAQIHSGGLLQATPHAVKSSKIPGITRETLAIFMEPMFWEKMDSPLKGSVPSSSVSDPDAKLPNGVPPLGNRWNPDEELDFGKFTERTLNCYY